MEKQKTKKKKFRGGFAECNDHCNRQRKFKKNKKHPLPSAGAVALGKEVKKTDFFAECRSCGTRQRV